MSLNMFGLMGHMNMLDIYIEELIGVNMTDLDFKNWFACYSPSDSASDWVSRVCNLLSSSCTEDATNIIKTQNVTTRGKVVDKRLLGVRAYKISYFLY